MALRDPVAVYNAASNIEAGFVCDALIAGGVEAFVIEDISQIGTWAGGLIPEIHRPQVWVDRTDVERAAPLLVEYERHAKELRDRAAESDDAVQIAETCEDCGELATFPSSQKGTVQSCPHCGAFVDVGAEDWNEQEHVE